jgi:hypothetical protein
VQTGVRYGYRLGVTDAGIEVFVGEAWAMAERLLFALDGARPNPAVGGQLSVQFVLPVATLARLELFDVTGRRVAVREVGSLGPGRHAVNLTEAQHAAPGIYLVRLSQGSNAQTVRVAVLD